MKRISFIILLIFSILQLSAQDLEDGYYRVSNVGSGRYVYVKDNTGKVVYQAATAEMGALELWKDHAKTYSDPASVIYIENKGTNKYGKIYDLRGQGTGVYSIIRRYVNIYYSKGIYQVYAEGKYLSDDNTGASDKGRMGTNRAGDYRKWNVTKMDISKEYFGIKPSIKNDGRYFQPFFADFGFSLVGTGMKVWLVKEVNEYAVVITPFTGEVVPARTPVIIECANEMAANNKLNLVYDYSKLGQTNKLAGVYFNNANRPESADARKEFDKNTMRVLGVMSNGRLGYVLSKVAADEETGLQYLEANKSYLPVESGFPEEIPVMTEAEYEEWKEITSVRSQNAANRSVTVVMLSGRSLGQMNAEEISSLPAGIYIIGGKKMVIR